MNGGYGGKTLPTLKICHFARQKRQYNVFLQGKLLDLLYTEYWIISIQCFLGGGLIEIGGLVNIFAQKGAYWREGAQLRGVNRDFTVKATFFLGVLS